VLEGARPPSGRRVFLVFGGVEWEAEVWLNGTFLGRHTGYCEPFRFDVSSSMKEKNVLAVRVIGGPRLGEPVFEWPILPDVPAAEQRYVRDSARSVPGHKIGMLRAGSGFGIHREVFLETAAAACVSDVFVRGDVRSGEAKVVVETDSTVGKDLVLEIQVLPENFEGRSYVGTAACQVQHGAGKQTMAVPMPGARQWQPTAPCLYRCRVVLCDGERTADAKDVLFGYRSFGMVTREHPRQGLPEGMFLLNGQPVFLRGTDVSPSLNAFWYWRQEEKLLDALLMVKAANFNAVRSCEHTLFPEVREMLDRLGVMTGGRSSAFAANGPPTWASTSKPARTTRRTCSRKRRRDSASRHDASAAVSSSISSTPCLPTGPSPSSATIFAPRRATLRWPRSTSPSYRCCESSVKARRWRYGWPMTRQTASPAAASRGPSRPKARP
jgi:beta-galactosidase/beta-glucuronidase